MQYRRFAAGAIALAALVGTLAACGDDSDDTASKTDDTAAAAAPVDLTVKATSSDGRFAFDLPAEISGGMVNLTLDNADEQPHEIALVKVAEGTKPEQVADEWLSQDGAPIPDFVLGAVAGVGNAAPHQKATSTQNIAPGTYVYFCTFGDGEQVHYKNGMLGEVTVKDSKGTGELPSADNTIVAEDYTFSNVHLKASDGAVKVDFKNIGPNQFHHAQLFPVKDGATDEQIASDLSSEGEPQYIDFPNGTGTMVLAPGQEQVTDLTLKPGKYVMVCFISDKAGGPPHFMPEAIGGHGMSKVVTVE
jgi:plastocyanin